MQASPRTTVTLRPCVALGRPRRLDRSWDRVSIRLFISGLLVWSPSRTAPAFKQSFTTPEGGDCVVAGRWRSDLARSRQSEGDRRDRSQAGAVRRSCRSVHPPIPDRERTWIVVISEDVVRV